MQTWGNALAALASGMSEGVARKRERKRQATLDEERRAAIERQQEAQDVAASRAAQLFPLQLQEAQLGLKSQQGTLDAQTAADAERQRQLGLQEGVPHPVKALIIADADRLAKEGWPVERIGIYLDGKYGRAVVLHHLGVAGNGPTAPSPTPAPIGQGQFQTSPVQFGGGSAAEGQTPSMSASGLGAFLPPEGANRVYTADQQALTKVIAAGLKDSSIQPEEAEPIWNARFKGVPMPAELSAIGPTATSAAALARTAAAENAKTIEFMMKAYQGLIDGKFPPAVAAKYGKRIWDQLVLQKVVPAGMEMPDFAAISAFESPAERATELWKRANFALTVGKFGVDVAKAYSDRGETPPSEIFLPGIDSGPGATPGANASVWETGLPGTGTPPKGPPPPNYGNIPRAGGGIHVNVPSLPPKQQKGEGPKPLSEGGRTEASKAGFNSTAQTREPTNILRILGDSQFYDIDLVTKAKTRTAWGKKQVDRINARYGGPAAKKTTGYESEIGNLLSSLLAAPQKTSGKEAAVAVRKELIARGVPALKVEPETIRLMNRYFWKKKAK